MVLDDFNVHHIDWTIDETDLNLLSQTKTTANDNVSYTQYLSNAIRFLNLMLRLLLHQLSNITNTKSNVLDLVFTNNTSDISLCVDQNTIIDQTQQVHESEIGENVL